MAFDLNQFLASPGFAMANQGLNNIYALRRDQVPTVSPADAYQQTLQRRTMLKAQEQLAQMREAQTMRAQAQEERAAQMHPLAMQKAEASLDPTYEFRKFVESRPDLAGMSQETQMAEYQKFAALGSGGASQRPVRTFPTEDGNLAYLSAAGQVVDTGVKMGAGETTVEYVGNVPYLKDVKPGGETTMTPLDQSNLDYRTRTRASEARTDVMAKASGTQDAEFLDFVDSGGVDQLESSRDETRQLLETIRSGGMQATGPLEGVWSQFLGDPETAQLKAKSVLQTLENLKIANLAPVSNEELKLVQDIYANIDRDPQQNIALLEQALEMLDRKIGLIDRKGRYFVENENSLRGFGTSRWSKPAGPAPGPTPVATVNEDIPTLDEDVAEEWARDPVTGEIKRVR